MTTKHKNVKTDNSKTLPPASRVGGQKLPSWHGLTYPVRFQGTDFAFWEEIFQIKTESLPISL